MSKHRILIIDDDEGSIAVLEDILELLNYEVSHTQQPVLSVEMARKVMPQLIILDWIMPERSGIQVLQELKSHPDLAPIPVIISTGVRIDSYDLKIALDSGAFDFMRKPIDEIELTARVASAIATFEYMRQIVEMQREVAAQEIALIETNARLLQNELDKKERELIASTINVLHNTKLINTIKEDLMTDNSLLDDKTKKLFVKILSRYENVTNSFNWQMFEKRFTELNIQFYKNLRQRYPNLSAGELRLCAYYKIGLSSKEIAILNYSNYEAIRKAVYRIRKKLNLPEKTELSLFLQDF